MSFKCRRTHLWIKKTLKMFYFKMIRTEMPKNSLRSRVKNILLAKRHPVMETNSINL